MTENKEIIIIMYLTSYDQLNSFTGLNNDDIL